MEEQPYFHKVGTEVIGVEITDTRTGKTTIEKMVVYVYSISVERLLFTNIPGGHWVRIKEPPMWKRVDSGEGLNGRD